MLRMKHVNPVAAAVDQPVVGVGMDEIRHLEEKVKLPPHKRTRLCAHQDSEETLHEMPVAYTGSTFIRPNKHPGKDKSLHILKGTAYFVFFDENGNVAEVAPLGDQDRAMHSICACRQTRITPR